GQNTPTATFKNAALPKIAPILIDTIRAQVWSNCPTSFATPFTRCSWARDANTKDRKTITDKMSDVMGGPTFAATIDLVDEVRKNDQARAEMGMLLTYLLDAASSNDA